MNIPTKVYSNLKAAEEESNSGDSNAMKYGSVRSVMIAAMTVKIHQRLYTLDHGKIIPKWSSSFNRIRSDSCVIPDATVLLRSSRGASLLLLVDSRVQPLALALASIAANLSTHYQKYVIQLLHDQEAIAHTVLLLWLLAVRLL